MCAEEDAEDDCCPSDELAQLMTQEDAGYRKSLKRDRRCMMCRLREPRRPRRVGNHVLNYHAVRNIWRASGRKQLRVFTAMYDNDSFATPVGAAFNPQPNYLRRSAELIRAKVLTDPPDASEEMAPTNLIDRKIRLIQYVGGPEFRHVGFIRRERCRFRASGCNFYSESFYGEVRRNAIDVQGRVGGYKSRRRSDSRTSSGAYSRNSYIYGRRPFSIFYSDGVEARISKLLDICPPHGEFESVTVDCAVNPTPPCMDRPTTTWPNQRRKARPPRTQSSTIPFL